MRHMNSHYAVINRHTLCTLTLKFLKLKQKYLPTSFEYFCFKICSSNCMNTHNEKLPRM